MSNFNQISQQPGDSSHEGSPYPILIEDGNQIKVAEYDPGTDTIAVDATHAILNPNPEKLSPEKQQELARRLAGVALLLDEVFVPHDRKIEKWILDRDEKGRTMVTSPDGVFQKEMLKREAIGDEAQAAMAKLFATQQKQAGNAGNGIDAAPTDASSPRAQALEILKGEGNSDAVDAPPVVEVRNKESGPDVKLEESLDRLNELLKSLYDDGASIATKANWIGTDLGEIARPLQEARKIIESMGNQEDILTLLDEAKASIGVIQRNGDVICAIANRQADADKAGNFMLFAVGKLNDVRGKLEHALSALKPKEESAAI
jgi:hypothetical protein